MTKTQFIWDPLSDNVLQEKDELGATQATYTNEPGEFGNLVSQNRQEAQADYKRSARTPEGTEATPGQ